MRIKEIRGIAIIIMLGCLLPGGLVARENKFEVRIPYTVADRDTLRSVALSSSTENEDTVVTLEKIKTYNNLNSKTIHPDDKILIPSELIDNL